MAFNLYIEKQIQDLKHLNDSIAIAMNIPFLSTLIFCLYNIQHFSDMHSTLIVELYHDVM